MIFPGEMPGLYVLRFITNPSAYDMRGGIRVAPFEDQDLEQQVIESLRILEEFRVHDYDDLAPISAPFHPRLKLEKQGREAWSTFWLGVLSQFSQTRSQTDHEQLLIRFALEELSHRLLGLTDIVLKASPLAFLSSNPQWLREIVTEYNQILDRPTKAYLIWPLQLGRGSQLIIPPSFLEHNIVFQGALLPEPPGPQSVDVDRLIRTVVERQLSSVIRDDLREAYLYVPLPDDCPDFEAVFSDLRAKLFAMLCALRLASSGDIGASQSCFLVDPVELLYNETHVSGDIPSPLRAQHLTTPWPQPSEKNIHDVVAEANTIYKRMSYITGLMADLERVPVSWASQTKGLSYTIDNPYSVNLTAETWLGSALQFLEYTYTRTDLEGIIHCWTILEALFILAEEPSHDKKNRYKSTMGKVAIRALVIASFKDPQDQQDFYNKVRMIGDTRNMLAHGKDTSRRQLVSSTLQGFRDTVRYCLWNVINWMAQADNEASASCQHSMITYLDDHRDTVLMKSQDDYYQAYKNFRERL